MTPLLGNPTIAAIGGINCTMATGFEVNSATAEELPPEPINPPNIIVRLILLVLYYLVDLRKCSC
jgi:hypothetical protein